jgi:hypothetical protein
MKSDRELQINVLDELRWEPGVKATDIGVTVKDGVVTLEGTVDSFAEKRAAERAVKRLPDIRALAIELEVKLPGSSERTDADIAEAGVNALKWDVLARISHQLFGTGFEGPESGGCGLTMSPWRRKSACG